MMTTLKWSALLMTTSIFFVKNPFLLGALLAMILLAATIYSTWCSIFMSFIVFLIYVGGLMILIMYCLMLIPGELYKVNPLYVIFLLGPLMGVMTSLMSQSPMELFSDINLICAFGVLLYLVMLSVVETMDYSSGMML